MCNFGCKMGLRSKVPFSYLVYGYSLVGYNGNTHLAIKSFDDGYPVLGKEMVNSDQLIDLSLRFVDNTAICKKIWNWRKQRDKSVLVTLNFTIPFNLHHRYKCKLAIV